MNICVLSLRLPVPENSTISVDLRSGVPIYRQIIDQVLVAISIGRLVPGARLPTVRQLAIDLHVNPNTVSRAYRELEIREIVTTQRGTGTFVAAQSDEARSKAQRDAYFEKFCDEWLAEAGKLGFSVRELIESLQTRVENGRLNDEADVAHQ